MNISDRVYVKTELFEGWATVTHIFPNESFFPIQIELDEEYADEDSGHRVKRIAKEHIIRREHE